MKAICRVFKDILLLLGVLLTLPGNMEVQAAELRISVAASLTDVFKELIRDYSQMDSELVILPNFGPSGGLAKQINQGAPADLYISANPKWMQFLEEQQRVSRESIKTFAHNSLVFIGHKNANILTIKDVTRLDSIALGSPGSVPAGEYARQALEKTDIYESLLLAGKLVMAKDVRQALIYADRGEADGAFVYKTDVLLATRAVVLFEVPKDLHSPVSYPLALTTDGADKYFARAFYDYLSSDHAAEIVKKYGFITPE